VTPIGPADELSLFDSLFDSRKLRVDDAAWRGVVDRRFGHRLLPKDALNRCSGFDKTPCTRESSRLEQAEGQLVFRGHDSFEGAAEKN
jgi:hypothetical protein